MAFRVMTISHSNHDQLLSPGEEGPGPIVRVKPDRLTEAVERLTASGAESDPDHTHQFIRFAQENKIDLDAFWARLNSRGRMIHSVLCVPSPGRTCMVFSSNPTGASEMRSIAGIIDHACLELTESGIDLAQALLEPGETLLRDAYLHAAFTELAMLSYLERPLPSRRHKPEVQWPEGITVESYQESNWDELMDVLDTTYEETLDCPGLFGLRKTVDILTGHRSSGRFDPSLWTILRIEGIASGLLLLNSAPASRSVELVYMGLALKARGKGLGTQLLNHGLCLLAGRSEYNITLAVDELNAPALAMYRNAGFRRTLRRRAMVRSIQITDVTD